MTAIPFVDRRSMPAAAAAAMSQPVAGGPSGLPSVWVDQGFDNRVFYRSRETPTEWTRALRELSPVSDVHGFLDIVWEPGDPWIPGQRWVLYEFVRIDLEIEYKGKWERAIDPAIIEELRGPHPRSEGHMCHPNVPKQFRCLCRHKMNAWKGGPCQLITLTQYQLFQKTGMFANPFWVIQGNRGGHKSSFDSMEKRLLQAEGLPTDPPYLGELPYAPFDGRVLQQIGRHNRLLALDNNLSAYRQTMGAGYGQHKATIDKEMRRQFVAFLGDQVREEALDFTDAYRKGEFAAGGTTADWEAVDEKATQEYIETGRMHRTSAYL